MYDVNKYKYFTTKNQVIAVSTYAGKIVRAVAKCNPKDEFDLEKGKALAAARLSVKVSKKRKKNAEMKLAEAERNVAIARYRERKMKQYLADAEYELNVETEALKHLEKSL